MITNVTYTNQFTDLAGYHQLLVETDLADVDIMSSTQSGIHDGGHSGQNETQAEMIAEVKANEEKGRLLKLQEESTKKQEAALKKQMEDEIKAEFIRTQDQEVMSDDDLFDELTGDKGPSDQEIAQDTGLPQIPAEQVLTALTDKIENTDASKKENAEALMKETRLIIDKSSPENLQNFQLSDAAQASIAKSYGVLLGQKYDGPKLNTYSIVNENVLKPYQSALTALNAQRENKMSRRGRRRRY